MEAIRASTKVDKETAGLIRKQGRKVDNETDVLGARAKVEGLKRQAIEWALPVLKKLGLSPDSPKRNAFKMEYVKPKK